MLPLVVGRHEVYLLQTDTPSILLVCPILLESDVEIYYLQLEVVYDFLAYLCEHSVVLLALESRLKLLQAFLSILLDSLLGLLQVTLI